MRAAASGLPGRTGGETPSSPHLADSTLWAGTAETFNTTVTHGIRNRVTDHTVATPCVGPLLIGSR